MIYFIADTHFGDERILRYENRPFDSADAMDRELIHRWNETVSPKDTVYVLGDWGKLSPALLRGRKYLIKGNHDTLDNQSYRDMGFAEVCPMPTCLAMYTPRPCTRPSAASTTASPRSVLTTPPFPLTQSGSIYRQSAPSVMTADRARTAV